MEVDRDYRCDSEFYKLLVRQPDVDLTVAALELARDANPHLEFQTTLEWIAQRAKEIAGPVALAKNEIDALKELGRCIADRHGIFGDTQAFDCAESSFLPRVIETGRGIPISLSLLYRAVASHVGIDLMGVSAPRHYLMRYEAVAGPMFLDAFGHGQILDYQQCVGWLKNITRIPKKQIVSALRPAAPRTTIIRMLNNLKALYTQQENWGAAWTVQHRLTALEPSSYQQRRDLALISVRADRPGQAVDLLGSCLKTCPDGEREVLEHHLSQAQGQLARWN